jgi:hypothetical protein
MGLFEEHPWILILLIIVTTEAWTGVKALVKRLRERGRGVVQSTRI